MTDLFHNFQLFSFLCQPESPSNQPTKQNCTQTCPRSSPSSNIPPSLSPVARKEEFSQDPLNSSATALDGTGLRPTACVSLSSSTISEILGDHTLMIFEYFCALTSLTSLHCKNHFVKLLTKLVLFKGRHFNVSRGHFANLSPRCVTRSRFPTTSHQTYSC